MVVTLLQLIQSKRNIMIITKATLYYVIGNSYLSGAVFFNTFKNTEKKIVIFYNLSILNITCVLRYIPDVAKIQYNFISYIE